MSKEELISLYRSFYEVTRNAQAAAVLTLTFALKTPVPVAPVEPDIKPGKTK